MIRICQSTRKLIYLKTLYNVLIKFCYENLITITSLLLKQSIYHITLIKIIDEFKQKLKYTYQKNSHWKKILDLIKSINQVNFENNVSIIDVSIVNVSTFVVTSIIVIATIIFATLTNSLKRVERFDLRFKYKQSLIYFIVDDDRERLCVSISLKQKIF